MRTLFGIIIILLGFFGYPQDLETGFYRIDEENQGTLVREFENKAAVYIVPKPILVLDDIENIRTELGEYRQSFNIIFNLNNKGSEKFKTFTKHNLPIRVAMVVEDKVMSRASIFMPIPNGMFILSGFDEKKAKSVLNKLLDEQ